MFHGRVAGGRSHGRDLDGGTRNVISCDGASCGGNQDRDKKTQGQSDNTGLEGQGGADGSWDQGGGRDLWITVELVRQRTMVEPEGRSSQRERG